MYKLKRESIIFLLSIGAFAITINKKWKILNLKLSKKNQYILYNWKIIINDIF